MATHADIDLETVAQLSTGSSELATSALAGSPAVAGAVVLATCNRFEIYGEAPHADDVEAARAALIAQISGSTGLNEQLVSRSFNTRTGSDVSQHLFSVSSGLDSAVVGEREIAGQVRRALITAQHEGTASAGLVRLFQAASKTAKDVGAQTALGLPRALHCVRGPGPRHRAVRKPGLVHQEGRGLRHRRVRRRHHVAVA